MNRTVIKRYTAAGALLFFGIFFGCGTSEYEQRLDARITDLKSGSKFNTLSSPIDVPGTQVSIRIPQGSKNAPEWVFNMVKQGTMVDGKEVSSRRIKPIVEIPDLKVTYEGLLKDSKGGKYPFYLYVAVSTGASRVNFVRILQGALGEKFSNTTELQDFRAQTPEGQSIDWQQCRGTGNQEFCYLQPATGQEQFQQMPGAVELFFHDEENTLVTLAWRTPTNIEESIGFKSLVNIVAGCVKIKSKAGGASEE